MKSKPVKTLAAGAALLAIVGVAHASKPTPKPPAPAALAKPAGGWVPPGSPGSPIDAGIFEAQVLLDVAGFPSGVIDGKKGMVFAKSLSGFQQAHNLPDTGKLDAATIQALKTLNRPSTIDVVLTPDQVAGPFV
ncbi:MAG: peptidoglycan-binding domain-containing protein, partial [Sphingomicrobium sp.]